MFEGQLKENGTMRATYKCLRVLSEVSGIETTYADMFGKVHHTDPETARRILEAKGICIPPERLRLDPQVLVVSADDLPDSCTVYFIGNIGEAQAASPIGSVRISDARSAVQGTELAIGSGNVRLSFDPETGLLGIAIPFPRELAIGTHHIRVEAIVADNVMTASCLWIVCPSKAYIPPALERGEKVAGIAVALYGVRSETNWGIGDFSDLAKIIDWAANDLSADVVGINPLHALFNRRPYNSSPYLPSSRLFRNFIYLDVPGIADFCDSLAARSLVESSEVRHKIRELRDDKHVNYEEVSSLKLRVLRQVFTDFMKNHGGAGRQSSRWHDFQSCVASEGIYLERFATFCALDEHFRSVIPILQNWREWPEEFHDPSSEEVRKFQKEKREEILFWMYLQWQINVQLRQVQEHATKSGMIIGLYNDEALAVDRNGSDFWSWREFFHEGFRVGAPPDEFAPDGQDWGFPPPNRERLRASGYELFLKKLESNCKHGGALRIDHVMQIRHLFWIPAGLRPVDGVYVQDYESDLLNLMALESQSSRTLIVGEDLGTVPFNFRERVMAKRIFSSRLLYFERDGEGNLLPGHVYPEGALVSIATHDLPTLAGFWSGRDIDLRRQSGLLDALSESKFRQDRTRHKAKILERLVQDGFLTHEDAQLARESPVPTDKLHSAVMNFLLATPSRLVVISQEDVFLDDRQQNLPGTTWQNPNWVTKMLYSVEELRSNPEAKRLAEKFKESVERSGRSHRHERCCKYS